MNKLYARYGWLFITAAVVLYAGIGTVYAVPSGKTISFAGKGAGDVVFDGRNHADRGAKCATCHPGLFKMKKGASPMTMRDMESGRSCGSCHNGRQAFAVNESSNCAKCHNNKGAAPFNYDIAAARTQPKAETSETRQPSMQGVRSDVDSLPGAKIKINKNAYAIVIGIERYRQKLPKADFASSDAQVVTEYLTKVLGYPEENVVTLLNEFASKSDFEKYFEKWLKNNVEPGSTVFVYYSGHGAPNPKTADAYLVPYDGDPSFIDETGYSLKRMYAALGKLPAKEVIVALDSCFSGAGGRSVIAKGSRPLVMNLQRNVVLSKNMTVLSASSGDQISSTYDEKGHGLFTYFMLKGIKNEDVTRPDGSIKIDDLFDYIKPQVERIARKQYNNEQTPQLIEPKK